jgi:hypothetical protein
MIKDIFIFAERTLLYNFDKILDSEVLYDLR